MSNPPPPSDPVQPYDPTTPLGATPNDDSAAAGAPLPPRPPSWSPPRPAATDVPGAPPASSPPGGRTPSYQPGYAQPIHPQPEPQYPAPSHPATAAFPAYEAQPAGNPPGGYPPGAYPPGQQPYGMPAPEPAPRRSNLPLIAVVVAVSLLLCGGVAVAGTLVVQNLVDRTKEAVKQIPTAPPMPTIPAVPTELPDLPDLPGLPAEDDPDLTGAPAGKTVTVVYEVTGDGTVEISYTAKLGKSLKRVKNAKLPWRTEVSVTGTTYVSVIALRTGTTEGTVGCRATVDGKEVASREAQGTFAIATCSKLVVG